MPTEFPPSPGAGNRVKNLSRNYSEIVSRKALAAGGSETTRGWRGVDLIVTRCVSEGCVAKNAGNSIPH